MGGRIGFITVTAHQGGDVLHGDQRIFGRCFGFAEEEQLLDNVRKGRVMDTHPAVVKILVFSSYYLA